MKAIFIAYNQAYGEEIIEVLEAEGQRGFTQWTNIQGRGHENGLPHMGSHAWPILNFAILTIVPDDKVDALLSRLKKKDEAYPDLGLRAFSWNIEQAV
jgi:nitrogen regulatory protein PII